MEGIERENVRAAKSNKRSRKLKRSGKRRKDHRSRKCELRDAPSRRDVNPVPVDEASSSPPGVSMGTSGFVVRRQGDEERQEDGAGEGDDRKEDQG